MPIIYEVRHENDGRFFFNLDSRNGNDCKEGCK